MSDNPLAGLRIPSMNDIVDAAIDRIGDRIIDLGNPLQRRRLKSYIASGLSLAFQCELERALQAATQMALKHVFRIMDDPDYQEKRKRYRAKRAVDRKIEREKKAEADRQARMDYSRRKLNVEKETVQ